MVAAAEAALAQAPPDGAAGAPSDRQQPEALQALLEEGATSQETKQPTGPDADTGGEELDTTEADVDPLAGAAATAHGSPAADGEVGGEGDEAEASGSLAKALGRVKCQWYEGIESWDVASIVGSHLDYHHRMAVICAAVGLDAPPPIPPRK
ncbi:unnamed protein product [Symbiodinium sp. KB8]|nr:unnamed protein product [Symbiodinium sp. KB8]